MEHFLHKIANTFEAQSQRSSRNNKDKSVVQLWSICTNQVQCKGCCCTRGLNQRCAALMMTSTTAISPTVLKNNCFSTLHASFICRYGKPSLPICINNTGLANSFVHICNLYVMLTQGRLQMNHTHSMSPFDLELQHTQASAVLPIKIHKYPNNALTLWISFVLLTKSHENEDKMMVKTVQRIK